MPAPLPTLDTSGLIYGAPQKADKLLAYFFASNYSQSNTYYGGVKSLAALIQQHADIPLNLELAVNDAITGLFKAYFDRVSVTVDVSPYDPKDDTKLRITIGVTFTQDGKEYELHRYPTTTNRLLDKIEQAYGNPS